MSSRRGHEPVSREATNGEAFPGERPRRRDRFGHAVPFWASVVAVVAAACLAAPAAFLNAPASAQGPGHVAHRGGQRATAGPRAAAGHTPVISRRPALPTAPPARVALPPSTSYVLVDVNTGNVLAGHNERLRVRPASLTKILTALVAVTYLPADARVPGTVQSLNAYPNIVGIQKGVGWPLNEVLQALLVYSANDAAYAIAQRVSGSLSAFGPVMDRAARQIGMSDDPVFHDPAGLDGSEGVGGGNLVSARDLAIAGRDLLRVPELAKIVKEQSTAFVDPTGAAHDLPSMDYAFLVSYPGAVGIKTGFTDRAGSCIMAAATRHGRTMLAVVMNGYNPTQSAIDLLNQGFATPVGAEPGRDRLPPVTLPSPPLLAHTQRRPALVGSRSNHSPNNSPAGAAAEGPRPVTASRPVVAAAGARKGPAPGAAVPARAGLAAVVQSWPGQTLLLLAGLGALLALWELVCTNRIYHRRHQAISYDNGTSVMDNLSGSRKRRAQLIASYQRHERPNGLGRAPRVGRQ
jgi:D-alanyl-D-alanine carboxypeptidase